MTVAELRALQNTLTRPIVATVVALLRTLVGAPLTPARFRLLVDALYPPVLQARTLSAELAKRFYRTQRADHTDTTGVTVGLPHYTQAALAHTLNRTVRTRLSNPDTARAAMGDGAAAVARHVQAGGRDTLISLVRADPVALGWARVPTGEQTCAFCLMLASRGPVYLSARSAGLMTAWHDRCDCQVVPVFHRDRWDGRNTYLSARHLWTTSTTGHSGLDALNAFRRALADRASTVAEPAAA